MKPITFLRRTGLLGGLLIMVLFAGCGGGSSSGGGGSHAAPTLSIAAGDGANVLTLTPAAGATGVFNIYWSTSPQVTVTTGTKIAGVTSPYTHTGLTNGDPIFYVATEGVGAAESVPSASLGAAPGKWTELVSPLACAPIPCGAPQPITPPARDSHTAVYSASSDRMIVFGGRDSSQALNDYWILQDANTANPSWNGPIATNAPSGRISHTAVYNDQSNRMVVFGGARDVTGASLTSELFAVSNANAVASPPQWSAFPQSAPSPRWGHAAAYDSANDVMIVFGGSTVIGQGISNEVWVLDHATTIPAWRQITPAGGPAGRCCMAADYDGAGRRMLLFGGFGGFRGVGGTTDPILFADLWILTFDATFSTATWQELTPSGGTPPSARCCGAALWDGGKLLVFGGGQFGSPADDKIYALIPGPSTFASADGPGGGPVARVFPTAVPAGPFLLFGGSGAAGPLNDLWRFN